MRRALPGRRLVSLPLAGANLLLLLQYQLASRDCTTISPYPHGLFDMWVARFLVPLRLLAWWASYHCMAVVARAPRHGSRSMAVWLALGVYFFTAGGSLTTTDAVVTFDVTRSIVERGNHRHVGQPAGPGGLRGADGRYYSPFGVLQSIYNIPFYVAGTASST